MKNNNHIKFILFMSAILFVSCDPTQTLILQKNDVKSSISIYGNQTIFPNNKENQMKYDRIIKIDSTFKLSQIYGYGLGNWNKEEIVEISKRIDSIVIIKNGVKNILKKEEINTFLLKSRKGLHNSKLILEN